MEVSNDGEALVGRGKCLGYGHTALDGPNDRCLHRQDGLSSAIN